MHEKSMENMYILCGLSNEASDEIRTALTEAAKEKGYNAVCVSRYRKEADPPVYQRTQGVQDTGSSGGDADQLSIYGGRAGGTGR